MKMSQGRKMARIMPIRSSMSKVLRMRHWILLLALFSKWQSPQLPLGYAAYDTHRSIIRKQKLRRSRREERDQKKEGVQNDCSESLAVHEWW